MVNWLWVIREREKSRRAAGFYLGNSERDIFPQDLEDHLLVFLSSFPVRTGPISGLNFLLNIPVSSSNMAAPIH